MVGISVLEVSQGRAALLPIKGHVQLSVGAANVDSERQDRLRRRLDGNIPGASIPIILKSEEYPPPPIFLPEDDVIISRCTAPARNNQGLDGNS